MGSVLGAGEVRVPHNTLELQDIFTRHSLVRNTLPTVREKSQSVHVSFGAWETVVV